MTDLDAAHAPHEWQGDKPHLTIFGQIEGRPVQLALTAPAITAERVHALRRYQTTPDGTVMTGLVLSVVLDPDGDEHVFSLSLENAGFGNQPMPCTYALVDEILPLDDHASLIVSLEMDEDDHDIETVIEEWSGSFHLAHDDAHGQDTAREDGLIGGFIQATMEGDHLTVSFTVPVSEAEIDDEMADDDDEDDYDDEDQDDDD